MATGKVKSFDAAKGFGFITPDDGGADVFVHITELERSGLSELKSDQRVEFENTPDRRTGRTVATNIRPLS